MLSGCHRSPNLAEGVFGVRRQSGSGDGAFETERHVPLVRPAPPSPHAQKRCRAPLATTVQIGRGHFGSALADRLAFRSRNVYSRFMSVIEIQKTVSNLSDKDRARLAAWLLDSLPPSSDEDAAVDSI